MGWRKTLEKSLILALEEKEVMPLEFKNFKFPTERKKEPPAFWKTSAAPGARQHAAYLKYNTAESSRIGKFLTIIWRRK